MKKQLFSFKSAMAVLLILAGATACKKDSNDQTGEVSSTLQRAATYSLVFTEDFNGTSLDTARWSIVQGNENVNNELQTYAASAVKAGNGIARLSATLQSANGRQYTSGKITTKNNFQIQYGRIEARISVPVLNGLAASFLLNGVNATAAQPAEIDIVQHVNRENKVDGGIRWFNEGGANFFNSAITSTSPGDFHIYAVEWDQKQIRWFADGVQYGVANIENNVNSTEEFHKPFFLDLKLAVGGALTGPVVIGTLPAGITVDYIKVFKLTTP